MKLGAMTAKACNKGMILLACAGLMLSSAVVGCDEDVTTTLVTGMNEAAVTAATALIDTAFQMITPETEPYNNNTGGGDSTTDSTTI
jgi:archaellum component FlaG (FlaF/FlaG flagellin family)